MVFSNACRGSLCSLAAAEQWAEALFQWLAIPEDQILLVHNAKRDRGRICSRGIHFVILSYNLVGRVKEEVQRLAPRVLVLDEAHCIKDKQVGRGLCWVNCLSERVLGIWAQFLMLA